MYYDIHTRIQVRTVNSMIHFIKETIYVLFQNSHSKYYDNEIDNIKLT